MTVNLDAQNSYDQIAELYDYDMGLNMAFDDVSYYVNLALDHPTNILELGAGTGRITLPLVRRGLAVTAVDISERMLSVLRDKLNHMSIAAHAGLLKLVRMDIRQWSLAGKFSTILCPYSLITYLAEPSEQRTFLHHVREQLCDGGQFIVDAFVPDEKIRYDTEVIDYSRLLPDGNFLTRTKILAATNEPQVNVIRRHYTILSPSGEPIQKFTTTERIRYFHPRQLKELIEACGFEVARSDRNYGSTPESPARFVTLCCRVMKNL